MEPRRTRTIAVEQFVDLADVDPMYFVHPYTCQETEVIEAEAT